MKFQLNINYPVEKMEQSRKRLEAARECLEAIGPCGGYLLGDGANICPGTPLENFRAIMEMAEEYGMGDGKPPREESS